MWRHNKVTGGVRAQFQLHNTEEDYFNAAHIQVANTLGHVQIQVAMPFSSNLEEGQQFPNSILTGVEHLKAYNKEVKSAKVWFKEVYHYLKHRKELFKFTKVVGTAWRISNYKEFTVFCGRRLEEPLKDNGWRHETSSVLVLCKDDFYISCRENEYKYLVQAAYNQTYSPRHYEQTFPKVSFWEAKDKFILLARNKT